MPSYPPSNWLFPCHKVTSDAPAPLEEHQGFVLRWMALKLDPNRDAS